MKKTNKFIAKKDNRETKVLVSFAFILAVLSLFSAYFITSLFDNEKIDNSQPNIVVNENISIVEDNQIESQNIQEMEDEIYNLIKTYIYASVMRENEILYAVSTDEWQTVLYEKLNNIETNNEEKWQVLTCLHKLYKQVSLNHIEIQ